MTIETQATRNPPDERYDLILVGSGMGALTVGSLMARIRGKRVLVVERHFKAGGFTHTFRRKQFQWDVGLHYVGQMGDDAFAGRLMALVTGGQVRWRPMPEPFERFVYPGLTFDLFGGKDRFESELVRLFPHEGRAIARYTRDVRKAASAYGLWVTRRNGSAVARFVATAAGWFRPANWKLTTKEYLDRHFQEPALKAVLASQWGDYGLPPSRSPFPLHALIVQHYLGGGYYPEGGAGKIAAAVEDAIEAAGGRILVGHEVTEILVRQGRACGVKVRKTNPAGGGASVEYFAPVIVSDAGALATYTRLVPRDAPIPFRDDLAEFARGHPPATNVTLYLGFTGDPRTLGFKGENHWIYAGLDHEQAYARRGAWIEDGQIPQVYLSFPSLKDPQATSHTAEIIAWADYDCFARWREQPWRRRDQDYQTLKERIAGWLIEFVERRYPGFAALIAYRELSTPITNEFFTGQTAGGIYGLPSVAERFDPQNDAWHHPRTPIPGLFLTGADVAALGIVGAMIGGMTTLGHLPEGISTVEIARAAARLAEKRRKAFARTTRDA